MVHPHIQLDIQHHVVLKICIKKTKWYMCGRCVPGVICFEIISIYPHKIAHVPPFLACHDSSPVVRRSMVVLFGRTQILYQILAISCLYQIPIASDYFLVIPQFMSLCLVYHIRQCSIFWTDVSPCFGRRKHKHRWHRYFASKKSWWNPALVASINHFRSPFMYMYVHVHRVYT